MRQGTRPPYTRVPVSAGTGSWGISLFSTPGGEPVGHYTVRVSWTFVPGMLL